MKTTWLLASWILAMSFFQHVNSSGVFQLRIESFQNDLGLAADGRCCVEPTTRLERAVCEVPCRTFFTICLSHYQSVIGVDSTLDCTYGRWTTTVLTNNSLQQQQQRQRLQQTDNNTTAVATFGFDFTWPGTFTLIIEAWHDVTGHGPTHGSQRVLIYRLSTQRILSADRAWHSDHPPTTDTRHRLVYSFRVVCDVGFYGNGCARVCVPRDDRFGHYTCDSDGGKVCLHGWNGTYCEIAVCSDGCQGFCDVPNECKCRQGWTGHLCDKCLVYPGCQHGTCQQPWQCVCQEGWGGIFCNQDLNYCTTQRPCRHGSTCINTGHIGYTCVCSPGFTGTNCEVDQTDCLHGTECQHGGICQVDIGGKHHSCQCPVGFVGRRCEWLAPTGGCTDNPCLNKARCIETTGDTTGEQLYRCLCRPGFTGKHCDVDLDDCMSQPCRNGGRCIDVLDGYRCVCPPGLSGTHCDVDVDDCLTLTPCLNGATCVDNFNSFSCQCPVGFHGELCQTQIVPGITPGLPAAVESSSGPPRHALDCPMVCSNGGSCIRDPSIGVHCVCRVGFAGPACSIPVAPVNNADSADCSGRCMNGGRCVGIVPDVADMTLECQCPAGFTGSRCQVRTPHDPLTNTTTPESSDVTSPSRDLSVVLVTRQVATIAVVTSLGCLLPVLLSVVVLLLVCRRRRRKSAAASRHVTNTAGDVTCQLAMNNGTKKSTMTSSRTPPKWLTGKNELHTSHCCCTPKNYAIDLQHVNDIRVCNTCRITAVNTAAAAGRTKTHKLIFALDEALNTRSTTDVDASDAELDFLRELTVLPRVARDASCVATTHSLPTVLHV